MVDSTARSHRIPLVAIVPLALAAFVAISLVGTPRARAYGWMIRHGYPSCATCHADPSGGSVLTPYGRAQGSLLLAQRWAALSDDEAYVKQGEFLHGAAGPLPEWLMVGGDIRVATLVTSIAGLSPTRSTHTRVLLMQGDVAAAVSYGRFRANLSLGVAITGAYGARIIPDVPIISRSQWVGVALGADSNGLLRAGRMNLPFGVRMIEHTALVRQATHTDINWTQQDGVSISYTGSKVRGEAMAILGNYQLRPDAMRERGYSAYVEVMPTSHLAIGASSLVTHAQSALYVYGLASQSALLRQAHGGFIRYAPATWIALAAEGDYVRLSQPGEIHAGYATMAQADFEPVRGFHLITTFEASNMSPDVLGAKMIGAWLSAAWFFFPHCDIRFDAVYRHGSGSFGPMGANATFDAETYLVQLHYNL